MKNKLLDGVEVVCVRCELPSNLEDDIFTLHYVKKYKRVIEAYHYDGSDKRKRDCAIHLNIEKDYNKHTLYDIFPYYELSKMHPTTVGVEDSFYTSPNIEQKWIIFTPELSDLKWSKVYSLCKFEKETS